ncbi:MAG: class I SAM-dependent methyltransferase [Vicinamibacterales bacterium]
MITETAYRQLVFATGCPRCGLIYASPFPPSKRFQSLYSEDGKWARGHQRASEKMVSSELVARLDEVTACKTPIPGSQVLDFGCGSGRWLNTFAAFGWETYGIDPSEKTAFTRHQELQTPGREPRFAFVMLSHVLEHVTNPGEILLSIGQATRPGGWVYIAVPGLDVLPTHKDWKYVLSATHVVAFSTRCLTELLARAGFGEPAVILAPGDDKAKFRLRLVARKDVTHPVPRHGSPLEPALTALRDAGLLGNSPLHSR